MKEDKLPASLSRIFRRNASDAENKLWYWLRDRQLLNVKFRRQQRIGPYIVDFVSFEFKLVNEVDGGQHNEEPLINKDKKRTEYLNSRGYVVLRFWNDDVLGNLDGVLLVIQSELERKCHPHLTSPVQGEE